MTHRSIHNLFLGLGVASLALAACADDTTTPGTENGDEIGTDTVADDTDTTTDDEVGTTDDTTDDATTDDTTEDTTDDATTEDTTDDATTEDTTDDTTDMGETADTETTDPPPGDAMLRVLHLGVDAPPVDIYLDGGDMPVVADLAFESGTDYLTVPEGPHNVAIVPAGMPPDMAVLAVDVDLAADTMYSAVAHNYLDMLGVLALVDDNMGIAMGEIRYQVSHTAPDVGQVDIWLLADPPVPLIQDLDYGGTQQIDAPAGAIPIGVDVNDDMIPDVTFSVPDLGPDILVDVYAVNEAGGAPVFLLAHLPDGSTARIDADACGDGNITFGEICEPGQLGDETCETQGFPLGGTLGCSADCTAYDTSMCNAQECGNGMVEGTEVCDGDSVGCDTVNPDAYAASANADCNGTCDAYDESACTSGTCCENGGAGSCEVQAVLDCVCAQDAFCCNNGWDGLCVGAVEGCGGVCP